MVMQSNQTSIVIQARMGSTRLPGKSMLPLGKTTVIGYLLKNLELSGFDRSQLCVATSDHQENLPLVQHVNELGYRCIVGPEHDVLNRYQIAAREIDVRTIVRLTGDNPLIAPSLVKSCIDIHFRAGSILTSTRRINPDRSITRFVPKGSSVDIFEKEALMKINSDSCDDFDREHVVPVLFKQYQAKIAGAEELKSYGVDVDQIKAVSIDTHQDYKEACQRVNTENSGLLS